MTGCGGRRLLRRFLDGDLDASASDEVASHVEDCADCRRILEILTSAQSGLTPVDEPDDPEPPPEFLERLCRTLPGDARPPEAVRIGRSPRDSRSSTGSGRAGHPPPPASVPGYEILGELGRGGMGVVYRARQVGLNRFVALKMILAGARASAEERARFRAEAEAVARLHHSNIVQIHDIGECDGCPYFSMELIYGPTLNAACRGRAQPARAAAALVMTLASALDCAHRQGILHRDLKPANVLLQPTGSPPRREPDDARDRPGRSFSPSDWTPKLVDFGLAKRLDDMGVTQHGRILGTPSYIAPEQADGRGRAHGPAVDIYALGAILYELLTGRAPFLGGSIESTLALVIGEDPIAPRRLRPDIPRDVETIALKCLEKEPARRYATAAGLAEDLGRFLADEPIAARTPSARDRLVKLVRRNRAATAGLAGFIIAMAAGIAATGYLALRENRARQQADASAELARAASRRAQGAEASARRGAYLARLSAAEAALREHDVARAARQLDLAPGELRGWEWDHLRARLDDGIGPIAEGGHCRDLIGFLADGRLAVVRAGAIELRHAPFAAVSARIPVRAAVASRVRDASVPRQVRFVIYENDDHLRLIDCAGRTLWVIPLERGYESIVWAVRPDHKAMAVWTNSRSVPRARIRRMYDLETGSSTVPLGDAGFEVYHLDFDPSGTRLAAACGDGTVRIWDATTGRPTTVMSGHRGPVRIVAFRPDGRRVASGGVDGTIRIWDPGAGRLLETPRSHQTPIAGLAYSPDGRRIASAGEDGPIRVWEPETNATDTRTLHGHPQGLSRVPFTPDQARRLTFSADGTMLASLGTINEVRLWDVADAGDPLVLRAHTAQVYPVAFSPDGRWIASGGWDQTVRLWDAASGRPAAAMEHALRDDPNFILSVAFSPDGSRLASWSRFGQIRVWDTVTGRLWRTLDHPGRNRSGFVHELAFCPDGTRLYAGKDDRLACWDARTGGELPALPLPMRETRIVAFRPDGRRLAAAGQHDDLVIVDPADGRVVVRMRHDGGPIEAVRFSPDGRRLATGGESGDVRLWDADTGSLLRTLRSHTGEVFAVAWHPDGRRLATAGRDRIIRIWDPESGDELIGLAGHSSYVFSLAFSPDGETLVSGSGDSTVRLWDTFPVARRLRVRRGGSGATSTEHPGGRPSRAGASKPPE